MSLLTLANLIDDTRDEIPNKEQAAIVRAVNKVVRRIYTEFVEPQESTFTTLPSNTTGTVAVTQDSTSVTFTDSVLSASDPLRWVQIGGDNAWFQLTRVSGTTGTLSSKWGATSDAAATFTIIYPVVTFPYGVGEIIQIGQAGMDSLKFRIGTRDVQTTWWWQMAVGLPVFWGPYTHDESAVSPNDDLLRIILSPAPDSRRVYNYLFKPRVAFLDPSGATSQTIPLQDRWYESIVEGTLYHVWKQEARSEKFVTQFGVYQSALARARATALPAAVIAPRRRMGGLWVYERRPIG